MADMTLEQAIQANDALVHTCKYPQDRDALYHCFYKYGFDTMYKRYYIDTPFKKTKRIIKKELKRALFHKI